MKQIRFGKNKDGENLPQINLALLFGEGSGLPFYYRKLAGNIPDSIVMYSGNPGYNNERIQRNLHRMTPMEFHVTFSAAA